MKHKKTIILSSTLLLMISGISIAKTETLTVHSTNSDCLSFKYIDGWNGEIDMTNNCSIPVTFDDKIALEFDGTDIPPIQSVWNNPDKTGGVSWHVWQAKSENNHFKLTTTAVTGNNDLLPGKTYSWVFNAIPNSAAANIALSGFYPGDLKISVAQTAVVKTVALKLTNGSFQTTTNINSGESQILKDIKSGSYNLSAPIYQHGNDFFHPMFSANPVKVISNQTVEENIEYQKDNLGTVTAENDPQITDTVKLHFNLLSKSESFSNDAEVATKKVSTTLPVGDYSVSTDRFTYSVTPTTFTLHAGESVNLAIKKAPPTFVSIQGFNFTWGMKASKSEPAKNIYAYLPDALEGVQPVLAFGLDSADKSGKLTIQWNDSWRDESKMYESVLTFLAVDPITKKPARNLWLSIGGAAGPYLQDNPNLTPEDAAKQIAEFADRFYLTGVDWDFEGGQTPKSAAWTAKATAYLKQIRPNLKQSLTLDDPIIGYENLVGKQIVDEAFKKEVPTFDFVNKMAFDFGNQPQGADCSLTYDPTDPTHYCYIKSMVTAAKYLQQLTGKNEQWAKDHVGEILMLGKDDQGRIVSPQDAQNIVNWMKANGFHHVGYWGLSRDQGGDDITDHTGIASAPGEYTKIFTAWGVKSGH